MPTTATTEQTAEQRKQALIEQIVAILQADLGLKAYEGEQLTESFNKLHFNEFWFPGNRGGSLKVFLDGGIPFVFDQYRVKNLQAQVIETNAKLKALFA